MRKIPDGYIRLVLLENDATLYVNTDNIDIIGVNTEQRAIITISGQSLPVNENIGEVLKMISAADKKVIDATTDAKLLRRLDG